MKKNIMLKLQNFHKTKGQLSLPTEDYCNFLHSKKHMSADYQNHSLSLTILLTTPF